MAMRCFGRAFLAGFDLAAATPLAFLIVLRAEDLAAVLWPDHFFFTAGCAAARDATFFLAICASLFCLWREANTEFFRRVGKATRLAVARRAKAEACPPSRAECQMVGTAQAPLPTL